MPPILLKRLARFRDYEEPAAKGDRRRSRRCIKLILMKFSAGLAVMVTVWTAIAPAATVVKTGAFAGVKVEYKVILPNGYDASRAYPTVLAFGGGPQTMRTVDGGLDRYWRVEAERRGYVIVSPAAPDGQLFFEGGARIFPQFLDMILHDYKVQGGKMHIAGVSNGGLSAFHVASLYPRYFWSVTGFPGLLDDATSAKVEALRPMCIYMHAGSRDTDWRDSMKQQAELFQKKGYTVQFRVEENQDHVLDLDHDGVMRLFDHLDAAARGCGK
jgi:poly(3-hydroxybutyrate) depolymerase